MDPLTIALIVSTAVNIGGSIISYFVQKGEDDKANKILDAARDEFGQIQPEMFDEAALRVLGPSEFSKIQTNPEFQKAQEESLARFKELQEGGGLNAEDKANLNRIRNETARRASSRSALLREEMQARGIGGSGAELALRQMEGQNEAELNSQAGLDVAAQAQKRYFDAVRERARMAGEMRDQDFNEQALKAQAADQIARFNAEQDWRRQQLRQMGFENKMRIAEGRLGLAGQKAGQISQAGQRTGQMIGGVAQNLGNAIYTGGKILSQPPANAAGVQALNTAIKDIPDTSTTFDPEDFKLSYPSRPMQFKWP